MISSSPKLGAMLHITPEAGQSPTQTYQSFSHLVKELDQLGFDNAWVTEHHFNDMSLTPTPLHIMGHFLAQTQQIKIGSAALLVGFHNPIEVAESLAVLDTLYPERVLCGFAKGGPFESQNSAFNADKDLSRSRMIEALPAMLELWQDSTSSTHHGDHYQWNNVNLQPKCKLCSERLFVATADEQTIRMAVENGLGLMAAQFWDLAKIHNQIALYHNELNHMGLPPHRPNMMVARGLFIHQNSAVAKQAALEHIRDFREQKSKHWGKTPGPMAKLDPEEMLSRMLCGTPEEVAQKVYQLLESGVTHLALNPLTQNHSVRCDQLHWFYDDIWSQITHKNITERQFA